MKMWWAWTKDDYITLDINEKIILVDTDESKEVWGNTGVFCVPVNEDYKKIFKKLCPHQNGGWYVHKSCLVECLNKPLKMREQRVLCGGERVFP